MAVPYKRIHIVINPASGKDEPILNTLNHVFGQHGVKWSRSVTHKYGDAIEQARVAIAQGVDLVAGYGGDGTQHEIANAVLGTETMMGILPGGTGNGSRVTTIDSVLGAGVLTGAPALIQRSSVASSSSEGCGLPSGGMCASSVIGSRTRRRSSAGAASSIMSTGPLAPPSLIASTVCSPSPPFWRVAPWHTVQYVSRIGAISAAYQVGVVPPASATWSRATRGAVRYPSPCVIPAPK